MIPVVILGLGRVGAGNIGLAGDLPMSHLSAVLVTPGLTVAGLVDPDPAARASARSRHIDTDAIVVSDLTTLPPRTGEVIAICTPASARLTVVEQTLARRPRVVVIEKPLAMSLDEARRIVSAAERAGVELRVNFRRRFDPRHLRWRGRAPKHPRAIVMRYGKGLMNYGSHLVDLLLDWYGPIEAVQSLSAAPSSSDVDSSVSFRCRMAAGFDAIAVGIDGLDYDQFEIDIIGKSESISLGSGGADIRRYVAGESLHYDTYSHLAEVDGERDVAPVSGFVELYAAIGAHIRNGVPLPGCDGVAAVAGMAVLDAVRRSEKLGGAIVTPESIVMDTDPRYECIEEYRQ